MAIAWGGSLDSHAVCPEKKNTAWTQRSHTRPHPRPHPVLKGVVVTPRHTCIIELGSGCITGDVGCVTNVGKGDLAAAL